MIATFLNSATATDYVGVAGAIANDAPAAFPTAPQVFINCIKGVFTDNIDGTIAPVNVTVFADPLPSPLPLLDDPPVALPPAPASIPAPGSIPPGSVNAVDKAKNLRWFLRWLP